MRRPPAEQDSDSPLPLREGARGRGTFRARALRKQATEAEQKLWQKLRRKQFRGLRFRRQYPLGPYFADFVCLPARLIVEVDGSGHAESDQAAYDERRGQWLINENFRVLRFWNSDIFESLESVVERIDAEILERSLDAEMRKRPLPLPSPHKGRGK